MSLRNKELERIDNENYKLMNRIVNQGSMLNARKLENDFRQSRRLQRSLQRNKLLPIKNLIRKKKENYEKSESKIYFTLSFECEK